MDTRATKMEIIEKLKWFHGEEFDKYPLIEEFQEIYNEMALSN